MRGNAGGAGDSPHRTRADERQYRCGDAERQARNGEGQGCVEPRSRALFQHGIAADAQLLFSGLKVNSPVFLAA